MDWVVPTLALGGVIAFFVRELCDKKTPLAKLGLQVLVVLATAGGGALVTMLMAQEAYPHYRKWARLEVSVDDAPFVGGGFFLGLATGAGLGIWGARRII